MLALWASIIFMAAGAVACTQPTDLLAPPPPLPVPVAVSLAINEFREISEGSGSFTIDFETTTRWRDPRLPEAIARGYNPDCRVTLDDFWRPDLIFTNIVAVQEQSQPYRVLQGEDTLVEWRRYVATLATEFDVAAFPFDSQTLEIEIIARQTTPGEVELLLTDDGGGLPEAGGWRVGSVESEATTRPIGVGAGAPEVAALTVSIPIARTWFGPFINVYLPILGCTLVALSVYFLPRDDGGNRIAISSTALLIAAAFSYLMADYISTGGGTMAPIDLFFWSSILIPFVAFVAALVSIPLIAHERDGVVKRLDSVLLFASAFVFVALTYLVWFAH